MCQLTTDATVAQTRDETLAHCISWSQQFAAEYPPCMASHLPMLLVAMHRLGASAARMRDFCHDYREANGLVPIPEQSQVITRADWHHYLGQREREGDYRAFFAGEIDRLGRLDASRLYLPDLVEGIAASAMHALMRMGYAAWTNNDAEVASALGYWASTFLCLGRATGAAPSTNNPLDVLHAMYAPPAFKDLTTEIDLLWHHMRAVSSKPEFLPVADMLAVDERTPRRMAEASLVLFASTEDFSALHALTAGHWMRMIAPYHRETGTALRYYWQAVAALVPKIGFPALALAEQLECWRNQTLPDWPELAEQALSSSCANLGEVGEHDLSLTFSAWEEYRVYGDPLYRFVAARRLQMA